VLRGSISFQNLYLVGSLVLRSGTCSCSDTSECGLVRVESILVKLTKVMIFNITLIALSFSRWISGHHCRILMLIVALILHSMTNEITINHVNMTADLARTAITINRKLLTLITFFKSFYVWPITVFLVKQRVWRCKVNVPSKIEAARALLNIKVGMNIDIHLVDAVSSIASSTVKNLLLIK
jgi:hypothetical protein